MLNKIKDIWTFIQDFLSIKGGLYVDAFAVVMLVRLLAVLRGFPSLTASEAAVWASVVTAFAATNIGGKE